MGKKRTGVGQETRVSKKATRKSSSASKRETKGHPRVWRTVRISLFGVGSLVVLGLAAGTGYVSSLLKGLPKVSAATFVNDSAASVVYDRNGKVIGRFSGDGDRQPISGLSQVAPDLVNAFIAAEDKTFFTNIGVNPLSMGRALVQDVVGHSIESGASTITQETVKMAVFPEQQRTMRRKIQEIALAIEVNHQLTKDEIMTDYMNWVYMGRMGTDNVYGVKRASEILFGKDPHNLTLPEACFLAALPNNPSYFSPYDFPKHTLQRQHYILNQMLDDKMITETQYQQAYNYNILKEIRPAPKTGLPPHAYLLLDEIKPRIISDLVNSGVYANANDAESALPVAGLRIYTTIDLSKQEDVEKVLSDNALFAGTNKTITVNGKPITDLYEAGFTLIDNQTGGILAVGGGRDFSEDEIDHANIARQPGSSIKPLLDYGPAIDEGKLTAGSILYDAPTLFKSSSGNYEPHDDEPDFAGLMTADEALYESRNVPAIDILDDITPQVGFGYLAKMGLSDNAKTLDGDPTIVPDDANHLASAIGGLDNGVTVEQMTSAYTTFPNQGVWHQSYMVSRIEDQSGDPLYQATPKTQQVFTPSTAYIITSMLHDTLYHAGGTATMVGANFPGQYISGKTGTTDSLTDGWFIGYTQKYTAGIWEGYNNREPIDGVNYNLKFTLWNDIMAPILAQSPAKTPWPKPSDIVTKDVSSLSGLLPTPLSTVHGQIVSLPYVQGTEPTTYDDVDVQAKYVVLNGKKYLATTKTPAWQIHTGVFIKLPKSSIPDWDHKIAGGYTDQTPLLLPTQPDPRGGQVLEDGSVPDATNPGQIDAPTGLSATLNGSEVDLTWQPVTGAIQYNVYRATSANGPYAKLATVKSPSYADTDLPSDATTTYYEVFAESNTALSTASQPVEVQLPPSVTFPLGNGDGNTTGNEIENGTDNNSVNDANNSAGNMLGNETGTDAQDDNTQNDITANDVGNNSNTPGIINADNTAKNLTNHTGEKSNQTPDNTQPPNGGATDVGTGNLTATTNLSNGSAHVTREWVPGLNSGKREGARTSNGG